MFRKSLAMMLVLLTCITAFPLFASSAANGTGFYQVTASSLNVRASASASSDIVGSLSNGDLITVTSVSGNWGQTAVGGITGWVSLNYCIRLYYVTFDANGGSNPPDAMLIADGNSIAVPSAVPTLSGKSFKGWSTSLANATDGIVSYSSKGALGGSSYITPSSDTVLYACWAQKTVSDPEIGASGNSTIAPKLSGETSRTVSELYDGVTSTKIKTSASSKYDLQSFNVIEFDLSQTDLYLDVTNTRTYANQLKTTLDTVTSFNSSNGEGKTAIAAVNGDLWMTTYAHSRVEGSGTSYGGYSDAVVTSGLTLPRGFNVYDGEIVCSAYMQQETPYEGEFWSFGITDEYVPMIGCPELEITVTDTTKNITASADGLNRLPANNALVVYSDKGCLNNYALSDAYEIAIDCDYDYTVAHATKITGKISGIYSSSSSSDPTMKANRIILTARGTAISLINKFAVGDTVTLDFSVTERYGRNTEGWQNVTNAVGGHMPFVVDGVKRETGTTTNYPTTVIGIKNDGSLCFIANDGRQSSFSTGLDFNMYWDLADDFDLNTAFILDGGGSTTLVELASSGYNVVNSPSDGSARTVVNSVILSAGPKRSAQGDFEVKIPDPNVDLTTLFFATDEDYVLIAGLNEAVSSQTSSGARLTVKDFYSAPGVVISYGLPNTTSYNPNSVLADVEYPSVNASDYPYVVFDMSVVSADSSIVQFQTLYTTAGSRKGISQDTFIGFNNAYNNSGYKLYTLNPGANAAFTGRLNSFHFGFFFPANGVTVKDGDYIILRSVRLAKTQNEAEAMTAVNASTLKFNANGGSVDRTLKYVIKNRSYGELPVPSREGYSFDGWYTSASSGTRVSADDVVSHTGVKNLYAHWTSEHTHTWGEWSVILPATCVIDGEEQRSCTGCKISESREIPATGVHSFGDWVTVAEARCETDGKKCRFCDDCDETITEIITAPGHSFGEWTVISYPHCDTEGTEAIFCDNCDEMQTRTIPAPGHVWYDTETVTAPGCESSGYVIHYCEHCDEILEEIVDPTGHSFGDWSVTREPGCTESGVSSRTCTKCKKSETEPILAIGHDYTVTTVEPTCTEKGYTEYHCNNCGDNYTDEFIDAKGHDYTVTTIEPTCTEKGYTECLCNNCGDNYIDEYVDAKGHDFGQWSVTVEPGCETEGEERSECANCDAYRIRGISALGHDLVHHEANYTNCPGSGWDAYDTCTRCDYSTFVEIPTLGHDYSATVVEPTCTEKGYTQYTCKNCGGGYKDSYTDAKGHAYGDWETVIRPACETNGEEKRVCTLCGAYEKRTVLAVGHDYSAIVVEPTCTEKGYTRYTCKNCGNGYEDSYTDAKGHAYGDWETIIPSACETDGEEKRSCANCELTETRTVPAKGHEYEISVTLPTCTQDGFTTHSCSCGDFYIDAQTSATGHDFDEWKINVAAECESDGEEKRICKNCDHFETRLVPAKGHNMGEWIVTINPTCVLDGAESKYCANCDHVETQAIPATGMHSFGEWRVTVEPTVFADGERSRECAACDAIETEAVAKLNMTNPFTDVKEDKWYTEGILYCYHKGYMAGVSETLFDYKGNVTRAMFATILAGIDGADTSSYTEMSFSDVKPGQWYSAAIEWAASNGYAAGLGEGIFGYKQNVSREQLAMFLYTYSAKNGIDVSAEADLSAYVDHSRIHSWALDALEWAVSEALISGTSDTTLSPRDSATRAEIALIVMNYVENIKTSGI